MKSRSTLGAVTALATLVLVLIVAIGPLSAQRATPQWDGSYTTAQAERGEPLFRENCAGCHGAALAGDEFAPPLTGAAFLAKWGDRGLGDLLDVMQNTMPQNSPGGLSRQQNADMLAFILQNTNVPAGNTELSPGAGTAGPGRAARSTAGDLAPITSGPRIGCVLHSAAS